MVDDAAFFFAVAAGAFFLAPALDWLAVFGVVLVVARFVAVVFFRACAVLPSAFGATFDATFFLVVAFFVFVDVAVFFFAVAFARVFGGALAVLALALRLAVAFFFATVAPDVRLAAAVAVALALLLVFFVTISIHP